MLKFGIVGYDLKRFSCVISLLCLPLRRIIYYFKIQDFIL